MIERKGPEGRSDRPTRLAVGNVVRPTPENPVKKTSHRLLSLLLASLLAPAAASAQSGWGIREKTYAEVIQQVTAMPSDGDLQARAGRHGLGVVNVMWEDAGRFEGSSVGPNISDLTLQVHEKTGSGTQTHLLPVIRHPNFTDKTADVAADKLWVRVGNQHGGKPVAVPLTEVLSNLQEYLTDSGSLKGSGNLLAKRDTHFLVSAQHVFVPLPKTGSVEFNPVLFNYQSAPESPAVLTLLVTREGTSATVIENRGEDMSQAGWGQQLFFNHKGQKTLFTAERRSAVKARVESGQAKPSDDGALEEGADMMMIIQVPLKHEDRGWFGGLGGAEGGAFDDGDAMVAEEAPPPPAARRSRSDVEKAVIGHSDDLGKFEEVRGLKLERDDRFPIRVTVQFYKATSNGVVSEQDLADVARTIDKVYESGDYVGSLVVPQSQQVRPTGWKGAKARDQVGFRWWPF